MSECKKDKYRKGTILTPLIMVWLVLAISLRRDLNYNNTLNWILSGFRWISLDMPAKLVWDGTISHARIKLGIDIFRRIFYKFVSLIKTRIVPDFHNWVTVMFDGTTMTMPDTKSNEEKFNKHKVGRGFGAFPQLRAVGLLALTARVIIDIAYAPIKGKRTGEKTLMFQIIERCKEKNFLYLFDAGFYSFNLAWYMIENGNNFIMKVASSIKLKPIAGSHMPDGSYLSIINGRIIDSEKSTDKRKKWLKVDIVVRVICFQIPGFRPVRLITTIKEENITAKEIVIHYHKRWDIEIAYDEIKTHQCATLKGHSPTVLRSKRSDLVEQELYAIVITYNLIRTVIYEAAVAEDTSPLLISFLDTLQHIIDCAPIISTFKSLKHQKAIIYLHIIIAESLIDRPRRPRCNPRVVKIKMSNFKRKRRNDKSTYRNFEQDITIINIRS